MLRARETGHVIMMEDEDMVTCVDDSAMETCEEGPVPVKVEGHEEQRVGDQTNQTRRLDESGTTIAGHSRNDLDSLDDARNNKVKEDCVDSTKTDANDKDGSHEVLLSSHEPASQGTSDVVMNGTSSHACDASGQTNHDAACRKADGDDGAVQLGTPKGGQSQSDVADCDTPGASTVNQVLANNPMPVQHVQ